MQQHSTILSRSLLIEELRVRNEAAKNDNTGHNEEPKKRISWDEYFMLIALLSARRSKDPSTQVGACIVDGENRRFLCFSTSSTLNAME